MSDDGVFEDDMNRPRLSDSQIDALLDGVDVPNSPRELAALLDALRHQSSNISTVTPSAALSELLQSNSNVTDLASVRTTRARRRLMAGGGGAFVGTLAGKVLIGAAVAAAAVGGAHVTHVVDVPGLPDVGEVQPIAPDPTTTIPQVTTTAVDGTSSDNIEETPGNSDQAPGPKGNEEDRGCQFGQTQGNEDSSHGSEKKDDPCPSTNEDKSDRTPGQSSSGNSAEKAEKSDADKTNDDKTNDDDANKTNDDNADDADKKNEGKSTGEDSDN